MKHIKRISVVLGVLVAVLTSVWITMQIIGVNRAEPITRPDIGKKCYIFLHGRELPKNTVITNTIGNEAFVDDYSRFTPLAAWSAGKELNVWSVPDAQNHRTWLGTAVLRVLESEWVRIDL